MKHKITRSVPALVLVLFLSNSHPALGALDWGTQNTTIDWQTLVWQDIGAGGYDTNTSGFGSVVTNADLGSVHPSLAGILVDVSVAKTDATTNTRWSTSNGTALSTSALGGTLVTFNFSQPVAFRRVALAGSVAFGPGEIEVYTSDSLNYMSQDGDLNLVGGVSIDAIPPAGSGSAFITVEDYATTSFTVAWDDDVGAALTQATHFQIATATPEPSSLVLMFASSLLFVRFRRERTALAH